MKWNNCINQQKYYKSYMFKMLQSQNYGLQQLTKLKGFMCTQNHEKR
jgi:hypothetical protein